MGHGGQDRPVGKSGIPSHTVVEMPDIRSASRLPDFQYFLYFMFGQEPILN